MHLTSLINLYMDPKILSILARIIVADVYKVIQPDDKIYFRATREKMLNKTLEEVEQESNKFIPIFQKEINPFRKLLKNNYFFKLNKPIYFVYLLFGFFMWARNSSKNNYKKNMMYYGILEIECLIYLMGLQENQMAIK